MPTIHDLPVEILVIIFSRLETSCHLQVRLDEPCSIVRASQVCRRWKTVVEESFGYHYFPDDYDLAGGICREMARAIEPILSLMPGDQGAIAAAQDALQSYLTFARYAHIHTQLEATYVTRRHQSIVDR